MLLLQLAAEAGDLRYGDAPYGRELKVSGA